MLCFFNKSVGARGVLAVFECSHSAKRVNCLCIKSRAPSSSAVVDDDAAAKINKKEEEFHVKRHLLFFSFLLFCFVFFFFYDNTNQITPMG